MKVKVNMDTSAFEKKLREKQREMANVMSDSKADIHEIIHKGVFDNKNYNPNAVYSEHNPYQAGEIYDLMHSGKLYLTLKNEPITVKETSGVDYPNKVSVKYGSVENLDEKAKYWRDLVYGRETLYGYAFHPTNTVISPLGKQKLEGYIYRAGNKAKVGGISPTWMFESWVLNTGEELEKYVYAQLDKVWSKK